jgi:hypothetical protein
LGLETKSQINKSLSVSTRFYPEASA